MNLDAPGPISNVYLPGVLLYSINSLLGLQYSNSIDSIDSIDSMGKTEKYSVHKRLVYRTKEKRSSNVRDTRSEESLAIININSSQNNK